MNKAEIKQAYIVQACNDFTVWTFVAFVIFLSAGADLLFSEPFSGAQEAIKIGFGDCDKDSLRNQVLGAVLLAVASFIIGLCMLRLRVLYKAYLKAMD